MSQRFDSATSEKGLKMTSKYFLTKKAIAFSIEKHKGQFRKESNLPYIVHPISVFSIVKKYKESKNIDEILASSILHDIIEDTTVSYEELKEIFGKMVADIVLELTNDKSLIKKIGKLDYYQHKLLQLSSYALTIKLSDMLDNITDNPTDKQKEVISKSIDYLVNNRDLTANQVALCSSILEESN